MGKILKHIMIAAVILTAGPAWPAERMEPEREMILFPDGNLFYATLANPREPRTHMTWLRTGIEAGTFDLAAVGFGESFGLIRWPGESEGEGWQLGISGGVFAQFNLDASSKDLINADYIIGFPLSYRSGKFSARARLYHQSSHLGDEFLLFPQPIEPVERINLSYEAVELLFAYTRNDLHLVAGPTLILHTDTPLERRSFQAGVDYESNLARWGRGRLFTSVYLHSWEETDWDIDLTAKLGFNFRKSAIRERAFQFFAEYFNGHLPFGQFYEERADYYGLGVSFGF